MIRYRTAILPGLSVASLAAAFHVPGMPQPLEAHDRELFVAGGMMSGHSLKHVAAAIAGLFVARMLWRRDRLHRRSIQGLAPAR